MENDIKFYIENNIEEMYQMLRDLCNIPAPSGFEEERAQYCKDWLVSAGAKNVYIDSKYNVIFPYMCENSNEITAFAAHTDTVFPDTEPMPYFDDGEKIHSPGVADDTASVVVLLMMARFFVEKNIHTDKGILFVCNSCEEGLGNLKGIRQIFKDFNDRINTFISFDSSLDVINDVSVGSHRYKVEVKTKGGHSYEAFGNENAIAKLSEIVHNIYKIDVPVVGDSRTTYNVGKICGGTSVNTIAQNAYMLCEYRSDNKECMEIMEKNFLSVFKNASSDSVSVDFELVGDRPCSDIEKSKIDDLKNIVVPVVEKTIGSKVCFKSASTDCNIPLSLGIPALCVGVNIHSGIHTREEWVDKASLVKGLDIAINLGIKLA